MMPHALVVSTISCSTSPLGGLSLIRCTTLSSPPVPESVQLWKMFSGELAKHDILEPSWGLQDVGQFDLMSTFPFRALFWRREDETRVRRRCALFDGGLGISVDNICIDVLHAVFLGPASTLCSAAIWHLIDSNVYKVGGPMDNRIAVSCLRLKNELVYIIGSTSTSIPT